MPVVITQTVRTAGNLGKSPVVQAGKSPAAVSVQLSGAQKNKVNDPGGGSFSPMEAPPHNIQYLDGRVRVRRLPWEHMAPGCTMGRRQARGGSVMLWAMFCWETLGPAIHVDVPLTRTTYLSNVADHVHPFMETVFPDGCGLFQQDNAPCHEAKMVQEWFDEHNNEFEVLAWPPNSPDLNPIEHLWDVLDKQVRSMEAPPCSLQDLKDLLLKSWCQIPQHTFRDLVESVLQRLLTYPFMVQVCSGENESVQVYLGESNSVQVFRDDDDINDVASMAGVNLSEESARILATNSELVGTQIRSCKDEAFLPTGLLHRRILETAKKYGVTEVPLEAVNFIAHATQTRLRTVLEKVSYIAQHRMDSCKDEEWHEQSSDVRSQLKFFEHLERLEKQRKDEQEREILLKAAKSRSRQEDPEQARLKQKAKEVPRRQMEITEAITHFIAKDMAPMNT
ncbi:hypothetical protein QTP86_031835, partial [Hemibagrus guttatus]